VLFGSLGLGAMVLVLNVGVVLAASSAALGKLHKIFQRKFHDGVPLSAHGRFFKRAPLALALCFLFPLVYELLAEKGIEALLTRTLEAKQPSYALALVSSPALLVGGFLVCFAATFGVHAMLFLFRYDAKSAPPAAPPLPVPQRVNDELAVFDRLLAGQPLAQVPPAQPSESDVATVVFRRSAPPLRPSADVTVRGHSPFMAQTVIDGSRRA
jgi:hypothetical protein